MMIKKILIANRGEIAARIIKTAKKMGIKTVAIYSEADTNSLYVRQADEAVYIGPSPSTLSYLNQKNILNAIKSTGADAVHPGFGFLSENYAFAELLEKNKITFIGPSSYTIDNMGDKIKAKKIAKKAGVNIIDGYMGAIKNEKEALKIANKIGYPIMLKAAAGGGGKGIRIVRGADEMKQAFTSTRNEARNNFSDERTFIEKYIENPRHIEIQVVGDVHGNYVCLGERECSIQRHHQKVIEEAPSTFIDEKTRKKMYAQSIALAKAVKYYSVGTVEFMVDNDQNFYFLEMNTRIQVEHPVTELVTGIDLIEQMILIAQGKALSIKQKDVKINGWAIECRICAEDPTAGFLPSTGRIITYKEPEVSENIRIDTDMYEGGEISMFYDSMIAKLCTFAPTRNEAIEIMNHALSKYIIRGISHNIGFLQAIINSARFGSGDISTNFISEEYKSGFTGAVLDDEASAVVLSAASFVFLSYIKRDGAITGQLRNQQRFINTRWVVILEDTIKDKRDDNKINNTSEKKYPITIRPIDDGYKISFENRRLYITSKWILGTKLFQCIINGQEYNLQIEKVTNNLKIRFHGSTVNAKIFTPRAAELHKFIKIRNDIDDDQTEIVANISGMVRDIKVNVGDKVVKGQLIIVIEAMKMENVILTPIDGVIKAVNVRVGDIVSFGEAIVEFA